MKRNKAVRTKKGQSLVETALILPLIVLILTGIIDFGLLLNNYLVIANASREGARVAAVGYTDLEINSKVTNLTATLDRTKINVQIFPSQSLRKKGDEVSVVVRYNNRLLTPIISSIVPNPLNIQARTVMRVE